MTKTLSLNGRGGLGTLRHSAAKIAPDTHAMNETPPLKKRGRKRKKLLVVVKYGGSGFSRRQALGERINALMTGTITQDGHGKSESLPVTTKTMSSTKPTHPFFMGKASQKHKDYQKALPNSGVRSNAEPKQELCNQFFTTPGKSFSHDNHQQLRNDSQRSQFAPLQTRKAPFNRCPEPKWPWRGFNRIEPDSSNHESYNHSLPQHSWFRLRRLKDKTKAIESEENIVQCSENNTKSQRVSSHSGGSPQPARLPKRSMETGSDLQAKLKPLVFPSLPSSKVHPALERLFHRLRDSSSAFDVGDCECSMWNIKYSPKSSLEVLQSSREMAALRDWLASLTTNAVETSQAFSGISGPSAPSSSTSTDVAARKTKRKRRKRAEGLDDFLISSDEELTTMHTFSDEDPSAVQTHLAPRSVIQANDSSASVRQKPGRRTNAVLLSGPHGCGKTAAVNAVAHELGFDIFEINSAARRSGKDVLEKIGDMTLNHQVRRRSNASESFVEEALEYGPHSEGQSSLETFFSTAPKTKGTPKRSGRVGKIISQPPRPNAKKQKQSLILLEEVDILLEDDKQFWETVVDLASQSKRPIIMTCNDETLVPLDDLSLHAIFRLRQPPADLTVPFLLAVAALEGHLIGHDAVLSLYRASGHDLRASLTELNFWCQMAVGDQKGGLEWFMQRAPKKYTKYPGQQCFRPMSKDTYELGMGWAIHETSEGKGFGDNTEYLLLDAWSSWGLDPTFMSDHDFRMYDTGAASLEQRMTPSDKCALLVDFDKRSCHLSDCDVSSRVSLPTSDVVCVSDSSLKMLTLRYIQRYDRLDATQPPLPTTALSDYVQGSTALQADVLQDYSQLDTQIAVQTHLSIAGYLHSQKESMDSSSETRSRPTNMTEKLTSYVEMRKDRIESYTPLSYANIFEALEPILVSTDSSNTAYTGLAASSFDLPTTTIVQDLAPYIRSIVDFDLALEQYRQKIASAMYPGLRSSKRLRTTKASRSAFEGSQRESARRERWFPKELDYEKVRTTAGGSWPRIGTDEVRGG